MFITKIAKRLMATVMTTALVLTGFVVAPKEVNAAEATPEVKVLGATLRLDGNSGYQSMRVGVEIANASQAKACGIKLIMGEKTYTVATDVANGATDATKGTNIYDYNSERDTVIYTAVIKDIPKDAFTTEIGVQGTVKAIGSAEEKISSAEAKKSVTSIVNEMKENNPKIEMTNEGLLVKKLYTLESNQTIAEKDNPGKFNYWKNGNNPQGDAEVEWNTTSNCYDVVTDSTTGRGVGYQFAGAPELEYIYRAQIKTESTNKLKLTIYENLNPINEKTFDGTGDWQTVEVSTKASGWNAFYFTTETPGEKYSIKSFEILTPLTNDDTIDIVPDYSITQVPLSGATFDGDCGVYDSETKTIIVNDTRSDGTTAIYIPLPVKVPAGHKVKVTISGTKWGTNDFRIWTTPKDANTSGEFVVNNSIHLQPTVQKDGSFTGTVELTAKDRECDNLTLKPTYGIKIQDLVISNIMVSVK